MSADLLLPFAAETTLRHQIDQTRIESEQHGNIIGAKHFRFLSSVQQKY